MKNKTLLGIAVIALTSFLTGCSKIPQAEIDAANTAIEAAKTAGAELYVPQEFAAVQDSMMSVQEKIEGQKSKWFANFDEAKTQLSEITTLATKAAENAEVRKNEIKEEIQKTLAEVKTTLEENKKLLTEAPTGKEGKTALEAIRAEITLLESSVNEATALLEKGEFLPTLDKVKASKEKALSINNELKGAIAKYSKGKPRKA